MSDLIKRQDAIMALRLEYPTMPMFKKLREEWAVKTEGYRKAEEVIMRLPSADRPQGEWIEHEHGFWTFVNDKGERDGWIPDYECNLCGARGWRVETPFCPTCGARMKGADDETD